MENFFHSIVDNLLGGKTGSIPAWITVVIDLLPMFGILVLLSAALLYYFLFHATKKEVE